MVTTNVVFLIDIQNGFARSDLTPEQGGSLYVPGGENVGEPAANLIRHLSEATIVMSQDFHPADHISFASNHKGAEPLSTLQLAKGEDGKYSEAVDPCECVISQMMWLDHCVQGTPSALFVAPIMAELPHHLMMALEAHFSGSVLYGRDDRQNSFFVVRKGTRPDLDSYGIATENDGISSTNAPAAFSMIAYDLQQKGVTDTNIYIGGLATNFCVEFSHKDVCKYLVPMLEQRGIKANVHLLTDISAAIPIAIPDGSWPDMASALKRMSAVRATKETTTEDLIRSLAKTHNRKTKWKLMPSPAHNFLIF
ncbi:MAG: hypothetical protein WCJ47_08535 [Methanomicrobiales archaeon]